VFRYKLLNYYLIPKADRDSWENIKNGPGDPYNNARVFIELFDKYTYERYGTTGYMTLTRGVQIDLAERWVKESRLVAREEPDIVY
jgi:hypothetical protein